MYTEKNKITNTFVIFRSIVLCCGMHPLYVPAPSIHGIKVALLPGCPPGYPSPLPRETIVWAVSDRSSTIDSSSGYYTVRTMRLYAHGQSFELLAVNVLTGQKRGRSIAALACKKEAELDELRNPAWRGCQRGAHFLSNSSKEH